MAGEHRHVSDETLLLYTEDELLRRLPHKLESRLPPAPIVAPALAESKVRWRR